MSELADAWSSRLVKDLTGFADRGTTPTVEVEGNTLRVAWTTRDREQDELFGVGPEGGIHWVSGPSDDASYADFLGSESMGGFDQLAAAMARAIRPLPEFVASEAIVEDGLGRTSSITASPAALADFADRARLQVEGRTTLFFLKGDPGAGKTTLLRETTARQAERYRAGDTGFLLFYVSAQGRELSNLRDAFSGELDDLRAGFTRDAIPALVRAGLLVPVIDGFDELLGTAGYSGAFSSLQTLLADLEGLGTVIVSARSAFYDIEFLGRSSSPANLADISITTIALEPWSDAQLQDYLNRAGELASPELTVTALERLTPQDRQLLRRPFFASQFPTYAQSAAQRDGTVDLLEHLIAAYIEREAGKIVDSNNSPVLPVDGHRLLFELAAGEMWEAEARQLSVDDLRTLTEIVAEEFGLGPDQATQLTTKVTSYAGFRAGPRGTASEFTFEHEIYFDYFLAKSLVRMLTSADSEVLMLFLDRGVIPEVVSSMAVRALQNGAGVATSLLTCSKGIRFENRRRNLGAILVAFAREHPPLQSVTIDGVAFVDLTFGEAQFRSVRFDGCNFLGVDLEATVFADCEADNSTFHALKLSNESRLGIAGLEPGQNVGSVHHPSTGEVYAPQDVRKILERLGMPTPTPDAVPPSATYSAEAQVLIQLLQHVARAYRRTNVLYEADDHLKQVFQSPHWPRLKQLLINHGIVSEEIRGVSGPRAPRFRLRVALDDLLRGQTATDGMQGPVAELWQELRTV